MSMEKLPRHPGIFKKGQRYLVTFRHKGRQKARSFRTLSEAVRFKGKVVALPTREHINLPINEQLIVELYSK